jgi:hypothetical protein
MLVRAQQKYQKLVQMGTQQRSSSHTIEIVDKIRHGIKSVRNIVGVLRAGAIDFEPMPVIRMHIIPIGAARCWPLP